MKYRFRVNVRGSSIDGTVWFDGSGWATDQRDAKPLTDDEAEAIIAQRRADNATSHLDAIIGRLETVSAEAEEDPAAEG